LTHNYHFFVLDLSKNVIGDLGAQHLSNMIRNNCSLVSLSLQNNNISSKGASMLCESMLENVTITHFDFSSPDGLHRNRMQAQGAEKLSQLLQKNDQLAILNLQSTSMEGHDIIALSEGLAKNQELMSLDISYNGISTSTFVM
jgi:Ran GTPase-activating protein (RanGAP) involved in mRNA processing and transport